jgi:hypothetical protein
MPATTRPTPDTILAHVRMLRLTDRLLDVAEELREARDELQTLLEPPPATTGDGRPAPSDRLTEPPVFVAGRHEQGGRS